MYVCIYVCVYTETTKSDLDSKIKSERELAIFTGLLYVIYTIDYLNSEKHMVISIWHSIIPF